MSTQGTATEARPVGDLSPRRVLIILVSLLLGMLLAALDLIIVATALPTIVGDLGGAEHISWIITAYLLAATVSTPLWGKLGDLYGRKIFFQASIVIVELPADLCLRRVGGRPARRLRRRRAWSCCR